MKSFAFVAAASAASASTCTTKAGQIDYIKPMVEAWETYNNWAAFNGRIQGDITVVNTTAVAKLAAIETAYLTDRDARQNASTTALDQLNAQAVLDTAGVQSASEAYQAGILSQYYSEFYAAGNRTERISNIIDGKLEELEAELNETTLSLQAQMASTTERYEDEISETYSSSNITYSDLTLDYENSLQNSISKRNAEYSRVTTNYEEDVSNVNSKFSALIATAEATRLPEDASYAYFQDPANYPSDCRVPHAYAIAQVEAEDSPNDIWNAVVIDGVLA